MRTVVCLSALLLAAILECQAWSAPPEQNGWRGRTPSYGGYGSVSCLDRGCPRGYDCRREIRVSKSPVSRCLPDIRSEILKRMDIYVKGFNEKRFQLVEDLFTVDSLITPSNAPLLRGRAGWGKFLGQLIADLKWDKLSWNLDTIEVGTDNFVSSIILWKITSAVNGPVTYGKCLAVWKKVRGVYEIDMFAYTFDQ